MPARRGQRHPCGGAALIAKITDGGSSPGLLNYLVGPGYSNEHEKPHLVAGSGVIMRRWGDWEELSPAQGYEIARYVDQFMNETGVRPRGTRRVYNKEEGRNEKVTGVANHVWHCSLSLRPDEGPLTDDKWRVIAQDFIDAMEFTGADGRAECRWAAVNHGRAKNGGDHIHIIVNVVREDGTQWNRKQDQPRVQRACNMLEHKYGLYVIESREHARGARADSAADLKQAERQGRPRTNRSILEERVRAAAVASSSELEFLIRLRELGVRARPRFAPGRTDVVTGYWVGLHARAGQRTQWYAGGAVARDLTLPRLRTRWPDTPFSAQQAVDAWRRAWRGMPPRQESARADLAARVRALDAYAQSLRDIDASDPVALADAARDVAGLLSAHALAAEDPRTVELLSRAARTAGRAAQTHRRPAPAASVPQAVSLAASLALSALRNREADAAVLAVQALALMEVLADCHRAAAQARTAAEMLDHSRAALAAVSTPVVMRDLGALRTQASYEALAGTAGPVQQGDYPLTTEEGRGPEREREPVPVGAPAMPVGASIQTGSRTSGHNTGSAPTGQRRAETAGQQDPGEWVRRIYQATVNAPSSRRRTGPRPEAEPHDNHNNQAPTRGRGRGL